MLRLTSPAPLFGVLSPPRLGGRQPWPWIWCAATARGAGVAAVSAVRRGGRDAVRLPSPQTSSHLAFAIFSFARHLEPHLHRLFGGFFLPWPFPRFPTRALRHRSGVGGFCSYVGAVLDLGPLRILHWLRLLWLFVLAVRRRAADRAATDVSADRAGGGAGPPDDGVWVTTAIRGARIGNRDAQILSLGFVAMLAAMSTGIPWSPAATRRASRLNFHAGTVAWGLSLTAVLLRRYIAATSRPCSFRSSAWWPPAAWKNRALLQTAFDMARAISIRKSRSPSRLALAARRGAGCDATRCAGRSSRSSIARRTICARRSGPGRPQSADRPAQRRASAADRATLAAPDRALAAIG